MPVGGSRASAAARGQKERQLQPHGVCFAGPAGGQSRPTRQPFRTWTGCRCLPPSAGRVAAGAVLDDLEKRIHALLRPPPRSVARFLLVVAGSWRCRALAPGAQLPWPAWGNRLRPVLRAPAWRQGLHPRLRAARGGRSVPSRLLRTGGGAGEPGERKVPAPVRAGLG